MSQRIKDKTLFGWLRNIFKKGDGGVHNDHHESLSDEDKIVEDYLEVGKFVVNRMKLTDVVGFECDLISECFDPLKAILKDDSTVELDYHKYVNHITSIPINSNKGGVLLHFLYIISTWLTLKSKSLILS